MELHSYTSGVLDLQTDIDCFYQGLVPILDQREPGCHLVGPGKEIGFISFFCHMMSDLTCGFRCFALLHIVMNTAK